MIVLICSCDATYFLLIQCSRKEPWIFAYRHLNDARALSACWDSTQPSREIRTNDRSLKMWEKITDSLYRSNKYVNSVPLQKPDRKWGTAVKWLNFIKLHSNVTYETALPTKNKFITNYLGNTITRLSSHLTVYLSDQGSIFKYIWKWYSHNPSFAGHLLTKVFPSEEIVQHTLPYPERNDIFFREHIWTKDI